MQILTRDIVILLISGIALYCSFYDSSTLDIKQVWSIGLDQFYTRDNGKSSAKSSVLPPLMADLDGDGTNELIVATMQPSLLVYDGLNTRGDITQQPLYRASLLDVTRVSIGKRPIAIATGYVVPYQDENVRTQRVFVVTEDWTVMCFDHQLRHYWQKSLNYDDKISMDHNDISILVSPIRLRKTDQEGSVFISGTRKTLEGSNTHFSFYALDGGTGELRWKHELGDFQSEIDLEHAIKTQHEFATEGFHRYHKKESSWMEFRKSILHTLPHIWNHPRDTKIELAHFERDKGSKKFHGKPTQPVKRNHIGGLPFQVGLPHVEADHIVQPNVLIAHTSQGIEVIHLYTGHTLCRLSMTSGSLYDDINGDDIIDQVVTISGRESTSTYHTNEHLQPHETRPCSLQVLSGIPTKEKLFNGTICMSKFDSNRMYMSLELQRDEETAHVLPPITIPSEATIGKTVVKKDIVTFSSTGTVSMFSSTGLLLWRASTGVKWDDYDNAFSAYFLYSLPLKVQLSFRSILVVGDNHLAILDRNMGTTLGEEWFPVGLAKPIDIPVIGDFNNDGYTDIVLVFRDSILGYSIHPSPPSKFVSYLVSLLIMIIIAVSVATYNEANHGNLKRRTSNKRSTD